MHIYKVTCTEEATEMAAKYLLNKKLPNPDFHSFLCYDVIAKSLSLDVGSLNQLFSFF